MSCAAYTRCGACAKPLPKPAVGRPRKCCPTDRCQIIYYGGNQRKRCERCHDRLPKGRAHQRAAICGRCFVDLCDLAGIQMDSGDEPCSTAPAGG